MRPPTSPALLTPALFLLASFALPSPALADDLSAAVEACLVDPDRCSDLPVDQALTAALQARIGDPTPYQRLGPPCQERGDCVPLAAFSAARCALSDPEGCATLSSLHESGLLDGHRPVLAAALAARACAFGHEDSCLWTGLPPVRSFADALDAEAAPMDYPSPGPLSLLLAACDAGAADACLALIRQLDADGPRSRARGLLVPLLDAEAARGRASAVDLLRTLRWLDADLAAHLWQVAAPLADACRLDLPRACALGFTLLHLERASGQPARQPALLDDTVTRAAPQERPEPQRWLEPVLPLGVGVSFATTTPLLTIGLGLRGGLGLLEVNAVVHLLVDAARPPAEATYRRFVTELGIGAALPLGERGRLHLSGGLGLGSRSTTGPPEFAVGPQEAVEGSWLIRGARGPTLGFRVGSHQSWTPSGAFDITGTLSVVAGVRRPGQVSSGRR